MALEIKKIDKFIYPGTHRETIEGKRHYVIGEEKLPSVTTILAATQSEEKRKKLAEWRAREGAKKADQIKQRAANRGSTMHKVLEHKILGKGYADMTELGQQATKMAERIAERGLCNVSDYYGTEVNIYYPGLYAGQTDLACVHNGSDAIVDFKQTNKPKQREWISDYFTQGAAYCMAHDTIYGTYIDKFVVMMCSADLYYQEFILQGKELKEYKYKWLERLDNYHRNSYINEKQKG
jgi:hypothetical protein|tara:strand:- start:301 stop:1011 length:711 start_codon:yes stop_codon:yes gene_type:complete